MLLGPTSIGTMIQLTPKFQAAFKAAVNALDPFNESPEYKMAAEIFNERGDYDTDWHESVEFNTALSFYLERHANANPDLVKALDKEEDKVMAMAGHAAVDPSMDLPF